jgi:hypothetical protein
MGYVAFFAVCKCCLDAVADPMRAFALAQDEAAERFLSSMHPAGAKADISPSRV